MGYEIAGPRNYRERFTELQPSQNDKPARNNSERYANKGLEIESAR
jgi:hypothetical protein